MQKTGSIALSGEEEGHLVKAKKEQESQAVGRQGEGRKRSQNINNSKVVQYWTQLVFSFEQKVK